MHDTLTEEKETRVRELQMDHTRKNYLKNVKCNQTPFDGNYVIDIFNATLSLYDILDVILINVSIFGSKWYSGRIDKNFNGKNREWGSAAEINRWCHEQEEDCPPVQDDSWRYSLAK